MSASLDSSDPRAASPGPLTAPTLAAQSIIRITGPIQVVLGLLFWAGVALTLLPLHMAIGMGFVLALVALAVLAALRGLHPVLVLLSLGWGLIVPLFGMVQTRLLPGPMHWVIQAMHLAIGLIAMVVAARLVRFIRSNPRSRTPAGGQTDRGLSHVANR
jgi:hypothetical protein